jgi:hypothetical protein
MNWSKMSATGTIRARSPAAGRLAGELRRAFVASAFVFTLCVLAALIANWLQASSGPVSQTHASGDVNLSTASMLVVPPAGDLCRERIIDNSTWRIRNKGSVDCTEALAKAANSGANVWSPGSRLGIISESFRGKP